MSEVRKPNILFVDDMMGICKVVALHLTRAGYDVTTCNSAPEVQAIGDGLEKFDAVVTDYSLREHTGLMVLEAVRAVVPAMPVLLWSSDDGGLTHQERETFTAIISGKGTIGAMDQMDVAVKAALGIDQSAGASPFLPVNRTWSGALAMPQVL